MSKQMAKLQSALLDKDAEIEQLRAMLASRPSEAPASSAATVKGLRRSSEDLRRRLHDAEEVIKNLRQSLVAVKQDREDLRRRLHDAEEVIKNLRQSLVAVKQDREDLRRRLHDAEEKVRTWSYQCQIKDAEIERLQGLVAMAPSKASLDGLHRAVNNLKGRLSAAEERASRMHQTVATLNHDRDAIRRYAKRLEDKIGGPL